MIFCIFVFSAGRAQNTVTALDPPAYITHAQNFLDSLSAGQKVLTQVDFNDTIRLRWQRTPGQRQGLKMDSLTEPQKVAFHALMRNCLSSHGF